jgi:hypothetical protein
VGSFLSGMLDDPDGRRVLVILGVVVIFTCLMFLYKDWAQRNQRQAWEVMARDPRRPVLYLRPFKADEHMFRIDEGTTFQIGKRTFQLGRLKKSPDIVRAEPLLLEPFEILGPLVAIGRPGEDKPPSGAARLYVGPEDSLYRSSKVQLLGLCGGDWQSKVRELLDQAQLAVLYAGTTDNFQWELGQVFHHEPFVPTVMLVPFAEQQWESFRNSFTATTGINLPKTEIRLRLIYFPERDHPIPFTDKDDEDDRLLTVDNPYLGALTRVMELIRPGSAAPWIEKAHANERAKILGLATGVLITLLVLIAKFLSGR